jgi:hypothetical protein
MSFATGPTMFWASLLGASVFSAYKKYRAKHRTHQDVGITGNGEVPAPAKPHRPGSWSTRIMG